MIQKLRNPYVMKWGLYIIIGLTIPAFVLFYGFGGGDNPGGVDVGTYVTLHTDEGKIELDRFAMDRMKQQATDYYAQIAATGMNIPPQQIPGVRSIIMNSIDPREVADFAVGEVALEQRLDRQDIQVTDQQVSLLLSEQGFTQEMLEQTLQARGITEYEFAARIKADLRNRLAEQSVERIARTSLLELWNEYLLANEEIEAEIVRISIPFASEEEIAEEAIAQRYQQLVDERDRTIIDPEKRIYEYLLLSAPAVTPQQPTEAQVRAAWEEASEDDPELLDEGGTQVRQILILTTPVMEEQELAEARNRIENARLRVLAGEDFAAVADEVSEDPRNVSWDDSGTTPTLQGGMIPYRFSGEESEADAWGSDWVEFVQEAEPGAVSEVIETPQGLSVVTVADRAEAGKLPYDKAREIVRARVENKLRNEAESRKEALISENISKLREATATYTSLQGMANSLGVDVHLTSPTEAQATTIPGVGNLLDESETLKTLRKGRPSPVLQTSQGDVTIVEIIEEIPEAIRPLEDVRARIESLLKRERETEKALAKAEEIKTLVEQGDNFTSATMTVDDSLSVTSIPPFTRQQPAQQLQRAQDLLVKLADIQAGDVLILKGGTPQFTTEVIAMHVANVSSPDMQEFMKDIRSYEAQLLAAKRQGYLEEYRRDARNILKAEYSEVFDRPEEPRRRRR